MSTVPAAPPVPAPAPMGTVPPQRRALAYLDGLLSGAEHKNGWQLVKVNGDAAPYGIQYLLNRARGSVAEARTALCGYVQDHLGDPLDRGISWMN